MSRKTLVALIPCVLLTAFAALWFIADYHRMTREKCLAILRDQGYVQFDCEKGLIVIEGKVVDGQVIRDTKLTWYDKSGDVYQVQTAERSTLAISADYVSFHFGNGTINTPDGGEVWMGSRMVVFRLRTPMLERLIARFDALMK